MEDTKTLREVLNMFPDGFNILYMENPYARQCVRYLQNENDPYYLLKFILEVNQELSNKINEISDYIINPNTIKLK